jgi:hypothetical protein
MILNLIIMVGLLYLYHYLHLLLRQPLQPVVSMASHAILSQQPNKTKSLAQEPEPSKGKQLACSPSSGSSKNSSHSVTSHSIPQNLK